MKLRACSCSRIRQKHASKPPAIVSKSLNNNDDLPFSLSLSKIIICINHKWLCKIVISCCPLTILTTLAKITPIVLLRQTLPPKRCPHSCSSTLSSPQYLHGACSLRVYYRCLCVGLTLYTRKMKNTNCSDSWTINAVAQDDFSDVPIPDAPAQPPHAPHAGVERSVSAAALNKRKEERLKS